MAHIVLVYNLKSNYNRGMKNILLYSIGLITLDQYSKFYALENLPHTFNPGIAFGIPIPKYVLIVLTIVLLITLIMVARKEFNLKKPVAQLLTALIFSGGISNLADRFMHGAVVDFISIGFWPSFNMADAYITGGILLIFFFYGKIKQV